MRRTVISLLGLALMVGAFGAIGCAKKEATPDKPKTPATTPADKPAEPAK